MGLLAEKRFAPFFWTQFLGAFTDNAFKQALILMITFQGTRSEAETGQLIAIASGLFVLPFFLFSPLAGQVSDKFEKATVMRTVKLAEIMIMFLAALGFTFAGLGHPYANVYLIAILFLMGTQSAFFGPVKYSIIPQHVDKKELMEATALVESGTFVAILTGTIVGGILIMQSVELVGASLIGLAIAGWVFSLKIPEAAPSNPDAKLRWNWIYEYKNLYRISNQKHSVLLSIIGISWFWFVGAMVLAQLPNFVRLFIRGDESIYIFFLSLFTLSIALGAVMTDRLSNSSIELGMVPFGAIGLTFFPLDIGTLDYTGIPAGTLTLAGLLGGGASWTVFRIIIDIVGMGIASSFYIVPLYALLQHRTAEESRSQVIAANNIAGALFMVASAGVVSGLYAAGVNTAQLFIVLALLNTLAGLYLFATHSEFVMRFVIWVLGLYLFRVRYSGREQIPKDGGALLIGGRSGLMEWCGITAASDRPVHFVVDSPGSGRWWLRLIFRWCEVIAIEAGDADDERRRDRVTARIRDVLADGQLVCLLHSELQNEIERKVRSSEYPTISIEFLRDGEEGTYGRKVIRPRVIRIEVGNPE